MWTTRKVEFFGDVFLFIENSIAGHPRTGVGKL